MSDVTLLRFEQLINNRAIWIVSCPGVSFCVNPEKRYVGELQNLGVFFIL